MSKKSKRNNKDIKMFDKLDQKFIEEFGERIGEEKIVQVNIADADKDYLMVFGANKNIYRVTPFLFDGLRPGKRRLFYSWWLLDGGITSTSPQALAKRKWHKIGKVATNSTGTLHPHGESATEDLAKHEGQYWSNNVLTIDAQGSYGNLRGDQEAAARYLEARMSEYTIDCFFDDFKNFCLPMQISYDGQMYEPEYLPAKYPHVLFNAQFAGIGFGLSSNIPSFNVTEVLDACITLLKNPKAKITLIPDIANGCNILDTGCFEDINENGNGKLVLVAGHEIDYINNVITFTSLPVNSNSGTVLEKISQLKIEKKLFKEIEDIKDYTKEGEVNFKIYLSKDAKPDKTLGALFKKNIGLKSTLPVGMTTIVDYEPLDNVGVRGILKSWIEWRIDTLRSYFLNKLAVMYNKQHMNDVLLMVFNKNNIDTTINIAKNSKSRAATIEAYKEKFKITSVQAGTLADMHVYNFNKDSYDRYVEEGKEIQKEIDNINEILLSDDNIRNFMIKQMEEGKKKWGHERRSKIIKDDTVDEDDIPDIDYLIGINTEGFIKKLLLKKNDVIGEIGKSKSNTMVFKANNREDILVIDNRGVANRVSVSSIPEVDFNDVGVELHKFYDIEGVSSVLEIPSMDLFDVNDDRFGFILVTRNGKVKRTKLSDLKKLSSPRPLITLDDGDSVQSAMFVSPGNDNDDIIIYTNNGTGLKFPLSDINLYSLNAKGDKGIILNDDEYVIGAAMLNPSIKWMLAITSTGKAKLIEYNKLPKSKRYSKSIPIVKVASREYLLGISNTNKTDILRLIFKNSNYEDIPVNKIPVKKSLTGEKITDNKDLISYKIFKK